jgi:hypothetical protein
MLKTSCNNLVTRSEINFCSEKKSHDFDCEYCEKFRVLNSKHIKYNVSQLRNK